MAGVPQKTLNWLYDVLKREYHDPNRTYSDLAQTLAQYPGLGPRTDVYTSDNGVPALLLNLKGVLPVSFRGTIYQFPLSIWIPHAYPYEGPIVYVTPTDGMVVRPGQHVSAADGKVYHHYLARWKEAWDRSHVLELMRVLVDIFAKEPPVMAKPQQQQSQSQHQQQQMSALQSQSRGTRPLPIPPSPSHQQDLGRHSYQPAQGPSRDDPPPPPPRPNTDSSRIDIARSGRYDAPPPLPGQAQTASPTPAAKPYGNHPNSQQPAGGTQYMPQRQSSLRQQYPPQGPSLSSSQPGSQSADRPLPDERPLPPLPPQPLGYQRDNQPSAQQAPANYPPQYQQPQLRPQQDQQYIQRPSSSQAYSEQPPPQHQHQHQHHQQYQPTSRGRPHPPSPQRHMQIQNSVQPSNRPPLSTTTQPPPQNPSQQPQPTPTSKPPTTTKDLLSEPDPFQVSLPTSTSNNNPSQPAPPIPTNPEKTALLSHLSHLMLSHLHNSVSNTQKSAIPSLQSQHAALTNATQTLDGELRTLSALHGQLQSNITALQTTIASAGQTIASTQDPTHASHTDKIPSIDQIIIPPTVVARQLYDAVAEQRGYEAAILALNEAFVRGRVGAEVWSRKVRECAREEMRRKWLVRKIGRGLGLEENE